MRLHAALGIVLGLGLLPGCYFDFDTWGGDPGEPMGAGPGYAESNLSVADAEMSGDLGNVRFEGRAEVRSAHEHGGFARIELHNTRRAWSMNAISIEGFDRLQSGEHYVSGSRAPDEARTTRPYVEVLGCSGPTDGNFDYDVYAEQVDVWVEDVDGQRRIDYVATFPATSGPDHVVTGSVTVDMR